MVGLEGGIRGDGVMGTVIFQCFPLSPLPFFILRPVAKQQGDAVIRDGHGDGIEGFHLRQPCVADDGLLFEIGNQVARIPLERKEMALL